ncbi:hypothetical protein ASA1KI_37290 [Opitutales bacterium ASA1]|uniref:ankyrin repeat domain-containing protein n=1 Tax=Congregicoccus parvus TaxID=3081749 RepID=UPI002B2A7DF4|nr:hypothetical protein ASA1KI_37290 [Opitutales bacterium ASA1]
MTTVSRTLPAQPHLDVPRREARALIEAWRAGATDALERVRARHPRFRNRNDIGGNAVPDVFKLADAQLVVAREYGFAGWTELKRRIESNSPALALRHAIEASDRDSVVRLLRAHPDLRDVPLWSGNWGPPMSHAANLGHLEIVEAIFALGAQDVQHASERAVLQGRLECARWLQTRGAKPRPGLVMDSCETLNTDGFDFLMDAGAPLTDAQGDRLAPLALVLSTYARCPEAKHSLLDRFAARGYLLPDTPIVALHRGDVNLLDTLLRRDPSLLARRFALREIYPKDLGCAEEGRAGMHWTPIEGTTLLHLAIDFREHAIFAWLLDHGANVNAQAAVDDAGFGGHTPLFHTVVNGPQRDPAMARALLARGARPDIRASLRKFLDWCERPRWHEAREVSAYEWGATFPDRSWVDTEALRLLGP